MTRYAWVIFFVLGVLSAISAPIGLSGMPPNPPSPEVATGLSLAQMDARIPGLHAYVSSISVQLGNFMLALGVLLAAIAAFPYRRGERWAWFATWIMVVLLGIQLINSRGGFLWQADAVTLIIVLAGLLLPYRRFFSRSAAAALQPSPPAG